MSSDSLAVSPAIIPARTRVLRRVFLSARWQLLAMLNWEIDPALVAPLVPRGCELDFHDGRTFVSVVGFLFLDTRLLGIPVPGHRSFEEVNLRFYVRRACSGEIRRGVVFIKEIVPRWAIARTARLFYNEPYDSLPMRHVVTGPAAAEFGGQMSDDSAALVGYAWNFEGRWNSLEVEYAGPRAPLTSGSHEEFIAEHYWGYCRQRDGGTVEYQVEHPPWSVWPATRATLDADALALYGREFAAVLAAPPTSAFLADGSAVAVMRPDRIA